MIRRAWRWMFGRRGGQGASGGDRIYRILFWLLILAGGCAALMFYFPQVVLLGLLFVCGMFLGTYLERRRRGQGKGRRGRDTRSAASPAGRAGRRRPG